MAYAATQHVRSAAGKISALWRDDTNPSEADIEGWLDDGSALVDVALSARGVSTPVANDAVEEALRPVVVDYALVRALDATFSGSEMADDVAKLRDGADARWLAWVESVADETNAIVDVLLVGDAAPLGTSFWQEEPDYGRTGSATSPGDDNFRLAPYIARGDLF